MHVSHAPGLPSSDPSDVGAAPPQAKAADAQSPAQATSMPGRSADSNAAKPTQHAKIAVRSVDLPHTGGHSLHDAAGYAEAVAHLSPDAVAQAHDAHHALQAAVRQPNRLFAVQAVCRAADAIRRISASPGSKAFLKLVGHHFHGPLAALGAAHLPHETHAMVCRLSTLCTQLTRTETSAEAIRSQVHELVRDVGHLTMATAEAGVATHLGAKAAARMTHGTLTVVNDVAEAMRHHLIVQAPTELRELGAQRYVALQLQRVARLTGAVGPQVAERSGHLATLLTKMGFPYESQMALLAKMTAALEHSPMSAKLLSSACAALETLAVRQAVPGMLKFLFRTMVATTNPILMLMALKDVGDFALAVTPVRGTDLTAGEWWGAELQGLAETQPAFAKSLAVSEQASKQMAQLERQGITLLLTRHMTHQAGPTVAAGVEG
jgi:hypothetical protein